MRRINDVTFFEAGHEDFTVEYDLFMHAELTEVGVLECITGKDDSAARLISTLEASSHTPRLLAGLLKVRDEPWTRELAKDTEAAVLRCTRPADKVQLFESLLAGLSGFFGLRQSILDDFPLVIMKGVTGRLTEREPPEIRGFKQYGQWDDALRVMAGYNPDILAKELRWHLRDFLLAYEHHLKQRAAAEYRDQMRMYAMIAPYAKKGKLKPPKVPRILRGRKHHGES